MGYYFDLIFTEYENLDCETVAEMFGRLGAKKRADEFYHPETDNIVVMDFLGFYPINVFRKERVEYMKGNWADIRNNPIGMNGRSKIIIKVPILIIASPFCSIIIYWLIKTFFYSTPTCIISISKCNIKVTIYPMVRIINNN